MINYFKGLDNKFDYIKMNKNNIFFLKYFNLAVLIALSFKLPSII